VRNLIEPAEQINRSLCKRARMNAVRSLQAQAANGG
jgi:hypothetical protein